MSDEATVRSSPRSPATFSAAAVRGFQEPNLLKGLEKKTIEELKDLHVDAVDDDEEDMIMVDGKGTFSWQVCSQIFLGALFTLLA